MLRSLLLPLLAVQVMAQSTSSSVILTGTRSVVSSERYPTAASYYDYGTSIVYRTDTGAVETGTGTVASTHTGNSTSSTEAPQSSALQGTRSMAPTNATGTQSAVVPVNTVPCNGHPEFCNKKYSNITMVAAHNSPFHVPNNLASNQDFGVLAQLNDGVRLVQGQSHFINGVPYLCHTSCDLLNGGLLQSWLGNVTEWLDANPLDVVTVLIGNAEYTQYSVEDYVAAIQASGIVKYAYIPPQIPMNLTSWPTLGEMIVSGKRAVLIMDYTNVNATTVPYVLDEFSSFWETAYDPTDPNFPCTVNRPPNLPKDEAGNRMFMINHNLNSDIKILDFSILVPNLTNIAITNGVSGFSSAGLSAEQCVSNWTRPPNFINVDYYNRGTPNGSIFEVAAKLNNVSYDLSNCCGKSQGVTNAAPMTAPHSGLLALAVAAVIGAISAF